MRQVEPVPNGKKIRVPDREPDMLSKRDVPYWFGPLWVRGVGLAPSMGRILPIKVKGKVELHSVSKDGNVTYIQGSIQQEFLKWHEDALLDTILLGMDEDDIIKVDWDYV